MEPCSAADRTQGQRVSVGRQATLIVGGPCEYRRFAPHRTLPWLQSEILVKVKVPGLTTPHSNEDCRRRGTLVWTTCPEFLRSLAVDRTRDLFIASPTSYRCATRPPSNPARNPNPNSHNPNPTVSLNTNPSLSTLTLTSGTNVRGIGFYCLYLIYAQRHGLMTSCCNTESSQRPHRCCLSRIRLRTSTTVKVSLPMGRSGPSPSTWFIGPSRVHIPNDIHLEEF